MLLTDILVESVQYPTKKQHDKLLKIFRKDKNVTHKDVEKLAKDFNVSVEDMQLKIYNILGDVLRNIGKHNDVPDDQFNYEELQMGIEEEMEHTKDPVIAKMIAKDHLKENPSYYTKLKKAKLADS